MVHVLIITAVLVAIAELGDKTQMLSLMLACRYPPRQVFVGVLIAVTALQLLATVAGTLVGDLLPERLLAWVTAALFIGFGVWSLRDASSTDGEDGAPVCGTWGAVVTVAAAFFLAELGDKTQVLTFAIAADPAAAARILAPLGVNNPSQASTTGVFLGVWLGSIIGMMVVNGLAIWAGNIIGRRVSRSTVARVSGVLFIIFGMVTLISAYRG
ncbi:MAG: TMEM165/GDT1 family protein [Coriobacteriia bacterium]|jgi:putative Ca2+/H+ antiporter (TMEM165/GDT1 family)|nr:TMEM165/GDT1 family protein [Coriobacteriia bacterium]